MITMISRICVLCLALFAFSGGLAFGDGVQATGDNLSGQEAEAQKSLHRPRSITERIDPAGLSRAVAWPAPIPCRITPKRGDPVMVLTLGRVDTPLAEGVFDPVKDQVTLRRGAPIADYYKDTLHIEYFKPIDKSRFRLPPSGWCSWYYYYHNLNGAQVRRNAAWMGKALRSWGATVCQIDDAWQGRGRGLGDNRDWTTLNERFQPGMDYLARFIREQGLIPGLWLAPHGQSNLEVVRKSGVFMVDGEGRSLSRTWEGEYLLDPTRRGHTPGADGAGHPDLRLPARSRTPTGHHHEERDSCRRHPASRPLPLRARKDGVGPEGEPSRPQLRRGGLLQLG